MRSGSVRPDLAGIGMGNARPLIYSGSAVSTLLSSNGPALILPILIIKFFAKFDLTVRLKEATRGHPLPSSKTCSGKSVTSRSKAGHS